MRVVTSERPGMGKSFHIQQLAKNHSLQGNAAARHHIIPIHGPEVTADTVMEFLNKHLRDHQCSMYHIDITANVC